MNIEDRTEFWDLIGKIEADKVDCKIVRFIGDGEKIPYIAMRLGISEKTVDRRLQRMRKRLSLFW